MSLFASICSRDGLASWRARLSFPRDTAVKLWSSSWAETPQLSPWHFLCDFLQTPPGLCEAPRTRWWRGAPCLASTAASSTTRHWSSRSPGWKTMHPSTLETGLCLPFLCCLSKIAGIFTPRCKLLQESPGIIRRNVEFHLGNICCSWCFQRY